MSISSARLQKKNSKEALPGLHNKKKPTVALPISPVTYNCSFSPSNYFTLTVVIFFMEKTRQKSENQSHTKEKIYSISS